jgi:hypothetical protein
MAGMVPPPRTLRLADGRAVVVRTGTSADLAGIVDFFERLSARSRYSRFFSPQPRLRRSMIERVVASGPGRLTVLAQPAEFRATTRHVVAVGGWTYVPTADRCDVSVAVADAWQNVQLGTGLVLFLLETAVARGHTRFVADVLETNGRMLGLLASLGATLRTRHDGGVACVEFELPRVAPVAREPFDPGRPEARAP